MDRLTLFQTLVRECGITTVPATSLNHVGELARMSGWIDTAWLEIQNAKDWKWLRKGFTLALSADDDNYAYGDCIDTTTSLAIGRFKDWRISDVTNPPRLYLTSAGIGGQIYLTYISWDQFEALYKIGNIQTSTGFPVHITEDPDKNLRFGLTPNDAYTLTGSYHRSAQTLTADAHEPEMPDDFHMLIVYQAMQFYGLSEASPEILERAELGYRRLWNQLSRNQSPRWRRAHALA